MNAVNLNAIVRVKLTKQGKEIYAAYHRCFGFQNLPTSDKIKDDYIETELWDIMNIFGKHLYNGCTIPFENNEIILVLV